MTNIDLNFKEENIPDELKKFDHWVNWNDHKIPINPRTNLPAKTNDPNTWSDFKTAKENALKNQLGIGFVFTKDMGMVGIDLDHVLEDGKIINTEIQDFIEAFDSYTEISPSGKGLHILVKSTFLKDIHKNSGLHIEIYDEGRYFTVTGNIYGSKNEIRYIEPEALRGFFEPRVREDFKRSKYTLIPNEEKKIELTKWLEQNWDLDKPEYMGNHHQVAEAFIVYLKKLGYDPDWIMEFLTDFTEKHPCKDGISHPEKDLVYLVKYVYNRDYKKIPPNFNKEELKKLWKIIHKNEIKKSEEENKNDAKQKEEEKGKILYKTRFKYDGFCFAEFSYNGTLKFLKYGKNDPKIINEYKIMNPENPDEYIIIRPAPQIAQTKNDRILQKERDEIVSFPPAPIEYESDFELTNEIKKFIHTYVEIDETTEWLLALYVLKSSVFDLLSESSFPFIHIIAPYGKGKSRLLTTLREITPYSFYSIDIKSAAIKRIAQLYEPVLFVDEKSNIDEETINVLNGRYNRNSVVINASQEIQSGFSSIIAYKIYGPTYFAGRAPFNDDALESKSFQINMDFELKREDIPRKLNGEVLAEFQKKGAEIRGKLLQFRIKHINDFQKYTPSQILKKYEKLIEPRLFEILSFFEDILYIIPELTPEVEKIIVKQIITNVEIAQKTPNGTVASIFLDLIEEETFIYNFQGINYSGVFLAKLIEEVGSSKGKYIGKILSNLGLKTDRPYIEVKNIDGNTKKKRVTVVRIPDEKKLLELRLRYTPSFVKTYLANSTNMKDIWDEQDDLDEEKKGGGDDNKNILDEQDEEIKEEIQSNIFSDSNIKNEKFSKNGINKDPLLKIDRLNRPDRPSSQTEKEKYSQSIENGESGIIHYFKSVNYYEPKNFEENYAKLIEPPFYYENYNYYKVSEVNGLSNSEILRYTNFILNFHLISREEYEKKKKEKEEKE